MSLLFDQERRLPPDPARMPLDPSRLPLDPARLPHDPTRLPHDPARLPADSIRLPVDSPGGSLPGGSVASFKVLRDTRSPAAVADFRPPAAVTASSGWPSTAPPLYLPSSLAGQGSAAESTRSSAHHMLDGPASQLTDPRLLVPEPVVRPAAAARGEPGRPLPFMEESQVRLFLNSYR